MEIYGKINNFAGWIWADQGNTTWTDMAGVGSIVLGKHSLRS